MQASPEGHISITGVSKYFGRHKALDNVSLEIPPGSVTVILGPSGSGKSTLLRTINHLERVDEGFIQIDGEYIGYRRKGDTLYELKERAILKQRTHVGYVFQNFNLFPHMTVLDNIIEAPVVHGFLSRKQAILRAYDLLDTVGLREKAHAWPRHLSGGQQQRIAIARALALNPKVMLFDEPTSALDPELVGEVLDVIKKLAQSGVTLVVVTHEIGFARQVADQVVFMVDGRVVESGAAAQVLERPVHARTRAFLEKVLEDFRLHRKLAGKCFCCFGLRPAFSASAVYAPGRRRQAAPQAGVTLTLNVSLRIYPFKHRLLPRLRHNPFQRLNAPEIMRGFLMRQHRVVILIGFVDKEPRRYRLVLQYIKPKISRLLHRAEMVGVEHFQKLFHLLRLNINFDQRHFHDSPLFAQEQFIRMRHAGVFMHHRLHGFQHGDR